MLRNPWVPANAWCHVSTTTVWYFLCPESPLCATSSPLHTLNPGQTTDLFLVCPLLPSPERQRVRSHHTSPLETGFFYSLMRISTSPGLFVVGWLVSCHCWIIVHCLNGPVYPLTCWGTSELLPHFGNCEYSGYKHLCADYVFSSFGQIARSTISGTHGSEHASLCKKPANCPPECWHYFALPAAVKERSCCRTSSPVFGVRF